MTPNEKCSPIIPCSKSSRPTTRPWYALKHFAALIMLISFILLPMSTISYTRRNKYIKIPSHFDIKKPILPNLTDVLTFSEIKPMARYLAFGPETSEIDPSKTFPLPIVKSAGKLLEYFHWHGRQMSCIREERCFEKHKRNIKIMIWKCRKSSLSTCSGVGPSFSGILYSLVIAMLTQHVFLIEWSTHPYPYSFVSAVAPGAIDWRVPAHLERDSQHWGILKGLKYPEVLWIKCPPGHECKPQWNPSKHMNSTSNITITNSLLNMTQEDSYNALKDFRKLFIISTGSFSDHLLQQPFWLKKYSSNQKKAANEIVFETKRNLLRALFKPSPITQLVMKYVVGHAARKNGYLSVHTRTPCTGLRRLKSMVSYCPTMATRILNCILDHEKKPKFIFVSSTSAALKKAIEEASSRYGSQVIHLDRRSLDTRMTIGHHILGRGYQNSMTWVSFIYTFADFFALANGTKVFFDGSSFSEQASLISNTKTSNIFNVHSRNKSLCRH